MFCRFLIYVLLFLIASSEVDINQELVNVGIILRKRSDLQPSNHSSSLSHQSSQHLPSLTHLPFDYSDPRLNPKHYNSRGINLAWVINADSASLKQNEKEISAIACYCMLYQVRFYVETVLIDHTDNRDYQQVKLRNVMKYLKFHDWVLVSDANVMVQNYSRSIYSYLDDRFDVILQEHDITTTKTFEIGSEMYFLRNSAPGWEFLENWYNLAPTSSSFNTASGDLQELLQQYLIHNFAMRPCYSYRSSDHYQSDFLPCVMDEMNALRNSPKWKENHHYYVLPQPGNYVKIVRDFMGFFRMIDWVKDEDCKENDIHCRFLYGDFLAVGKDLSKYIDRFFLQCDLPNMKKLSVSGSTQEILTTPKERWYSSAESAKLTESVFHRPTLACPNYNKETGSCRKEEDKIQKVRKN
jgi:hypothetical protein